MAFKGDSFSFHSEPAKFHPKVQPQFRANCRTTGLAGE